MEQKLREWLDKGGVCYLGLTYTECYDGLISVTFLTQYDLDLYLGMIKYKSKFNKSEFLVIPETLTVIVNGGAANEIIRTVRGVYNSPTTLSA